MAQYGKTEYWDERYTRDAEPFDWYQRWAGLKDCLAEFLEQNHKILMLGSGNSRLSEEMYDEGYQNITNIDISDVVVKAMQEKYGDKPGMTYAQMDAKVMSFDEEKFDVVFDKATLDSILCGEGSSQSAQKMLGEVSRVLTSTGVYIAVSHGQPAYRLTYLQRPEFNWTVKTLTVQKPLMGTTSSTDEKDNVHYVYVCIKGGKGEGEKEAS